VPQRDWFIAVTSLTALFCCSRNFTGCETRSESSFDWPFWCSSATTRQHLGTWQTICSEPQLMTPERDWSRPCRTNWLCAGLVCQWPETVPSALLRHAFGTVCRQASPQLGHCQYLRNILKPICSTYHIICNCICLSWPCLYINFVIFVTCPWSFAYGRINLSFVVVVVVVVVVVWT